MKFLRKILDKQAKHFEKGGKLERLFPLWEANDTFLYTPGDVTKGTPHVRDALDLKRLMVIVVIALMPCMFMAMYNTGLQANLAIGEGAEAIGWRGAVIENLGVGFSPQNFLACLLHGALYYIPIFIVTFAVGGGWEVIFGIVRKEDVNEGFLVTGMLFPMLLPATIPLWQVALGISFGVVIGKEVFGGTGMNIVNPALVSRAFLFFSYPGNFAGDNIWVPVDGHSSATLLVRMGEGGIQAMQEHVSWMTSFIGLEHGSLGETSALACLIGAVILIVTGVASWRIMLGVVLGTVAVASLLNVIDSDTNPAFNVPFYWHFVIGGWALGAVFMATDPVSAPYTNTARFIYGFMIGGLIIMVRVLNPAFPGGVMLAILLMNVFGPLIDHYVVQANVRRRKARYEAV